MTHIEMVEKLRERADVNYADAKDALERADWDLLDAMILLEKEGKVRGETAIRVTPEPERGGSAQEEKTKDSNAAHAATFRELLGKLWNGLKKLVHLGNINLFIVEKNGAQSMALSVTVLVILILIGFWVVVPLLILGLFFGYRYGFQGPHLGRDNINSAMHKATDLADDIKDGFKKDK